MSREDRSDPNDQEEDDSFRKGFEQHEMNDLARDLGLSKKASELLASRLNQKKLLEKEHSRKSYKGKVLPSYYDCMFTVW